MPGRVECILDVLSAALLAGMTAVCSDRAAMMRSKIFACALGACLVISACSEYLVAEDSPTGPPKRASIRADCFVEVGADGWFECGVDVDR
ncbi:hypothetical protein [Rhodococcus marinonascens]|uniref:hypothetical protein n=1 Tax=Rhodococcus marinonascens TaxID=38311 RepID=UPI000AA89282|nr:hypothetical protein [Rhodococcus marinonascens]